MSKPDVTREIGIELAKMIDAGSVAPVVGPHFPLERTADALNVIDRREAVGKVVLDIREG
jgi:NADPH2:quinone reductase